MSTQRFTAWLLDTDEGRAAIWVVGLFANTVLAFWLLLH